MHARRQRRVAARHHATRPIRLQSDLNTTNAARTIRLKLWRITKRRHKAATFVAVDEVKQRFAGLEAERFAVDEGSEGGEILDHDGARWEFENRLETRTATGEAFAQKIHAFFDGHGEAAADEFSEVVVAFDFERVEHLPPGR